MTRQVWDAADYDTHGRFVSTLGEPVLDLLAPRPGERILDLGCGDGALTARLAERGASVVGVDTSPSLLDAARARGLDARLADAHALPFSGEFDAVFSNAALHWMREIDAVLAGVRRALKPGGRFVGEFGGHGNVAAIGTALRAVWRRRGVALLAPWYYPTVDEFADRLAAASFDVASAQLIPRPTPLPSGMADWIRTFANWALDALPAADRDEAVDEAVQLLAPALRDARGHWTADYVRLRFAARATTLQKTATPSNTR
jgi:SAM-dependent methyltransferase